MPSTTMPLARISANSVAQLATNSGATALTRKKTIAADRDRLDAARHQIFLTWTAPNNPNGRTSSTSTIRDKAREPRTPAAGR